MTKNKVVTTNWPTLLVIISGMFLFAAHIMESFDFNPVAYRFLFIIYYLLLLVIDYNEDGKISLFRICLVASVILLVAISIVSL